MNENGFFIRELRLTAPNKEAASIILNKGLNVITGPSDTGKSYIFQCIDYMFGASSPPKEINESKGYKTIYLEISKYDGRIRTLERSLTDSEVKLYKCKIDDISTSTNSINLKSKHNAEKEDNISSYLLKMIGIKNWRIKKNQRGTTQSFSFRNITDMIMLDEKEIISEKSPILSGNFVTKTSELSAFRAVMTGEDDSDCYEIEDPKVYKSRIKGKLEVVNELIEETKTKINKKNNSLDGLSLTLKELNKKISKFTEVVTSTKEKINDLINKKREMWNKKQEIDSRIIMLEELIERFSLLKESYISDLERLEFITEGGHYLAQLFDVNCPLCNSEIVEENKEFIEKNSDAKINEIKEGCIKEKEKIESQLIDLESTVKTMKLELKEKVNSSKETKDIIKEIEESIEEKLKPISLKAKSELTQLISSKGIKKEIENNKSSLHELYKKKEILNEKLKEKRKKNNYSNEINENIYQDFCSEIKSLLKEWNYSDAKTVNFNKKSNDIVVSGKKKETFGKGYRAILNSAFIISIMSYVRKVNLKHPGLVVLDSPLTTYKEGKHKKNINDEIKATVKESFYNKLSKIKGNKQIIILENDEPSNKIKNNINYIHFTQQYDNGRYGFISISK